MLKLLSKKSVLFIFSTLALFLTNTNVSCAVRNPDVTQRTGREAKISNQHIQATAIVAPHAVDAPDTTKLITREKQIQNPSVVLTRDLRDLQKLEKTLRGNPKQKKKSAGRLSIF